MSPFGWGEICIRDFEAVVAGSLLIKPSMQHLRTLPDIYRNRKTYVAVQWDFSDLGETCVHYLENEAARRKITANALREYARYSKGRMFLQKMKEILDRLRLRE